MNSSLKVKSSFVFIGSVLTNIIIGNSLHWISFITFYLHYYNNEHQITTIDTKSNYETYSLQTYKDMYFILTILFIFSNMSNAVSPFFTKGKNIRIVLFISFFLIICAYSLLYYITNNYSLTIIAFILYGIGIGLPYKAVIENVWKYFNHSRNAVAFINVLAFAGSAPLFNMLCNSMIQKEFIDKEVKSFLWMCILLYVICAAIIIVFSFDYSQETKGNTQSKMKGKSSNFLENSSELNSNLLSSRTMRSHNMSLSEREFNMQHIHPSESNIITIPASSTKNSERPSLLSMNSLNTMNTNINNMIKGDVTSIEKTNDLITQRALSLIFGNHKIYFIILYYSLLSFIIYAWILTSPTYPQLHSIDFDEIYSTIIPYLIYSISFSRFIMPFILSFLGEQRAVIIFGILQTLLSIYLKNILTTMEKEYYYIAVICIGFLYTGNSMLISNIINKIYGNNMAYIVSGIVIGIGSCMSGVFYIIHNIMNDLENIFLLGTFTTIIAVLLNIAFIKLEVFDYSQIYRADRIEADERNNNEDYEKNNVFDTNSINDVKSNIMNN